MAAIGEAGTRSVHEMATRALTLGSAAALSTLPDAPNRKQRRAMAAVRRKKPGQGEERDGGQTKRSGW